MSSPWRRPFSIWGYGAAVLAVGLALLLARLPALHLESAPVSLFLVAVVLAAWWGGVGPGLFATGLSALFFYYAFLPPLDAFAWKVAEIPRFSIFFVSTLFVAALGAGQRKTMHSLRRSRDDLKQSISELEKTNRALIKSQQYLAEAQAISQTGSFDWIVSSGELFWSEETFRIFGYDPSQKPTLALALARIHHDDRQLVEEKLDAASRGEELDFDVRLALPDGSVKKIHVVGHALNAGTGNLEFVGAVTDITAIKNAFDEIQGLRDQLYRENLALREEIDVTRMFEEIVGSSPPLQAVLSQVSKVAPTDSTVLITGETGTGKELIARAIHKRSQRSSRAFVSVNCAAIPHELIGSELFGHEKGAFTGATQRRLGRFESADGGTIFLDEIGELPLETQTTLLRVLQEREYQRLGGDETLHANVRVVAASNRNLKTAVRQGAFREDLFYRLNVFPIEVPALRDRREDIPLLVEYFIDRYANKTGKKIIGISKKSMELLQAYHWPGNIRELQNVIERAVIVSESGNLAIDESWLGVRSPRGEIRPRPLSEKMAAQEREMIEAALAASKGRVSGPLGAAAKLGVPQSTLDSKIKALKIDKYRFKNVQSE